MKVLKTEFEKNHKFVYRNGNIEQAERAEQEPVEGDETPDAAERAENAENFSNQAAASGDAAVNQAITRAQGITAEHTGTYRGRKEVRNVNGYDIMTDDGGAGEKRAIAAAMRARQTEAEAADRELQDAMADTEASLDAQPVNDELAEIDAEAETAEAEVTANTQAGLREAAAAGNQWAAAAGIEDDPLVQA